MRSWIPVRRIRAITVAAALMWALAMAPAVAWAASTEPTPTRMKSVPAGISAAAMGFGESGSQVAIQPSQTNWVLPATIALIGGFAVIGLAAVSIFGAQRERVLRRRVEAQIDEQRAAQDALHREQDYARAVVRALQDGLLVINGDGVVVEANRKICEITGYARDDLVGQSAPLPFWPTKVEAATTASKAFTRALTDEGLTTEAEFRRASGNRIWLAMSSATLHDDDGAPSRRVVTLKNVTHGYLVEHERQIRDSTDQLTGLVNHSGFQEKLREETARAVSNEQPLSLVLIDVDHLKRVNQVYGHQAGDQVLREISRRVMSCIRPNDLFARVGGEKFAILMPDCTVDTAYSVAERARNAVATHPMPNSATITISAGIGSTEMVGDAADLYGIADGARYWAKSTGRNRCVVYDPETVTATSLDEYRTHLERQSVMSTIRALARAVDAKDVTTRQHSERVASLSGRIALELGWSTHDADLLYEAGLVHDVGKIGIPDAVLFKPARLTEDEYSLITTHATLGAQIVAGTLSEEQVSWVRGHHERWNGRGYPDRLVGDEIPEGARILALADAWDVMTVARIYGAPRTMESAIEECLRESGEQFWPPAVNTLVRMVHDGLVEIAVLDEDAKQVSTGLSVMPTP